MAIKYMRLERDGWQFTSAPEPEPVIHLDDNPYEAACTNASIAPAFIVAGAVLIYCAYAVITCHGYGIRSFWGVMGGLFILWASIVGPLAMALGGRMLADADWVKSSVSFVLSLLKRSK